MSYVLPDCATLTGDANTYCLAANIAIDAAYASQTVSLDAYKVDVDQFFLVWGAALVIFMHAGFAMLSAGAVRTKNVKNILLCITLDLSICAIAWFLCGFAFAYGNDSGSGFIGNTYFVGINVGEPGYKSFGYWIFQFAFAATSATIVSGAIAERARFTTYALYSFIFSAIIYPPIVHMVWGSGILTLGSSNSVLGIGAFDFAGDGPVHMIGGWAGLLGAYIMGPRIGRFDPSTGAPIPMPGHSAALLNLGTWILIVGWFGFNPGSVLGLGTEGYGNIAGRAAVNTALALSAGCISALLYAYWVNPMKSFDITMAMNGALAGLVSITGPCGCVQMWAAIIIGLIGGVVYVASSRFLLYKCKIDDPLDATAVHFFCGVWGLLAGGAFVDPNLLHAFASGVPQGKGGFLYPGAGGDLLGAQICEIVIVIGWTTLIILPVFLGLNKLGLLRISSDEEEEGMDSSHHGGSAYPEQFQSKPSTVTQSA